MAWFGPWDPKKFFEMQKRNPQITPQEYEFLKSKASMLKDLGMMASKQARVSHAGVSVMGVDIEGVTDNIPAINNVGVELGRVIAGEEVRRHARVAFIGNVQIHAMNQRRYGNQGGGGQNNPKQREYTAELVLAQRIHGNARRFPK